jgi:hypothetical protein
MQKLPRSERHYRVTEGRLVEPPVEQGPQLRPTLSHDARQKVGRESRRAFKRVGTAPRGKIRQLSPSMRDLWFQQHGKPSPEAIADIQDKTAAEGE